MFSGSFQETLIFVELALREMRFRGGDGPERMQIQYNSVIYFC